MIGYSHESQWNHQKQHFHEASCIKCTIGAHGAQMSFDIICALGLVDTELMKIDLVVSEWPTRFMPSNLVFPMLQLWVIGLSLFC